MTDATSWRLAPRVRWLDVDGEIVAFNPENGAFVDLDPVATGLWHLLVATAWSVDEASSSLADVHGATVTEAGDVIEGFLRQLADFSIVTPPAGSAAEPRGRGGDRRDALG